MDGVTLIIILGLITFAGVSFSLLVKREGVPFGERLFLGWAAGLPLSTYTLFLLGAVGIRINRLSIALAAVLLSCLFLIWRKLKRISFQPPRRFPKPDGIAYFLMSLLVVVVVASGIIGLYWPICRYDGMDEWAVRGMAIAGEGGLSAVSYGRVPFYPLNVSLAITIAHSFDPSLTKLVFWLTFVSFLGLFYYNLRVYLSRNLSLFFTLFLATVPYLFEHSTRGFADLPLALYFAASTFYLLRFIKDGERGFFWLSAVFCGAANWTKGEGLFLLAVNSAVLLIFLVGRGGLYRLPLYAGLALLGIIPWHLYSTYVLGYTNPGFGWVFKAAGGILAGRIDLARLKEIAGSLLERTLQSPKWGWLLGCLVLVTALRFLRLKRAGWLAVIILLHLALLLFVYYGNPLPFTRTIRQTAKREFLHILPLIVLYISLLAAADFEMAARTLKSLFRRK